MSVGPSLTHIRAGQEGIKGDSAWAVSQQERWVYPVWLRPQRPGPGHMRAGGTTEWVLAAVPASLDIGLGSPSKWAVEGDEAMVMT